MDLTVTAQIIQSTQALASQTSWPHVGLAAFIGTVAAPAGQAAIEHALSNPKVPAQVKAVAPSLLALGLGYLATRYGVTPEQAVTAAACFAGATHAWNGTSLAADSGVPK